MSTLKVSTISPLGTDATKTITLGESGGTLGIASGAKTSGFGKIGQVVQTIKTDTQTIGSTSYVEIMSVNITPTNTSSKVLLMWNLQCNGNDHFELSIFRGTTQIYLGDASGSRTRNAHSSYAEATNSILSYSGNYLDSPSSSSEQTYYIKGRSSANASYQIYVNRSVTDQDRTENGRTASDITGMEILD